MGKLTKLKVNLINIGLCLAFLLIGLLAIRLAFIGGVIGWLLALFMVFTLIMVLYKKSIGYSISKFNIGLTAICVVGGVLDPYTYDEVSRKEGAYMLQVVVAILLGSFVCLAFYGICEQQKITAKSRN